MTKGQTMMTTKRRLVLATLATLTLAAGMTAATLLFKRTL